MAGYMNGDACLVRAGFSELGPIVLSALCVRRQLRWPQRSHAGKVAARV